MISANLKTWDHMFIIPFICSHDPDVIEEATIYNIRIDRPVSDNYDPGKEGYH
jgi:hypothetical protein